ncbi:hypothetical protein QQX10_12870 [Demequina sp. SYSU T00039]|uniref:SAP domain-containing protein n=1 Tax=Demequina lignilytica TaxID=3051663 RepID=A0AAW7M9X1_9MICO|nr:MULTISPECIES: hypothetical protein [unclassified Demequina]MDN4479021.1 hypothetical protein [Demequina sp. SYSU T00039-1]MDN4489060.1 hypothetical protein [Demequina sp. SYSU T00039]
MVQESKITSDDLLEIYGDSEWRTRYLSLVDLVSLLRNCIVGSNYRISDDLNNAIVLTDYGRKVRSSLITKHDVPAKEATLICLLEVAHEEPLIDIDALNLDALAEAIAAQILRGSIRYPLIFGGELYGRAAELFPDLRRQLNVEETSELLDDLECGVFQAGSYVVGPLGILRSKSSRWFPPTLDVPLQHCYDMTCHRVHPTHLATDHEAPVNVHLPKVGKVLDTKAVSRGAWTEFSHVVSEEGDRRFDDLNMTGLAPALGDCLTREELERLATYLGLEVGSGSTRALLLQRLWAEDDRALLHALDALIASREIEIGEHVIRRPRLAVVEIGNFGLRTELGHFGVRVRPADPGIPHLRLARLVAHLYDLERQEDATELEWQLRGVEGADTRTRLDEYLRTQSPSEVVRVLVLSRRAYLLAAFRELLVDDALLELSDDLVSVSDDELIGRLLWKLGFEPPLREGSSVGFWRVVDSSRRVLRDASASAVFDLARVRAELTELFIHLERVLEEGLEYSWWALSFDHVAARRPFTFSRSEAARAWAVLDQYQSSSSRTEMLRIRDRRTLYPLGQAFGLLADQLADARACANDFEREDIQTPRWTTETELLTFNFNHTIPFLDLLPSAQDSILASLRRVSDIMKEADVSTARNGLSHFQRTQAQVDDLERAVEGAAAVVRLLDKMGATFDEYRRTRRVSDEWGRSVITLRSCGGDEVAFTLPSSVAGVRLPSSTVPQYIFRAAVFALPNEMLRFRPDDASAYEEMWAHVPQPRRPSRHLFDRSFKSADTVAQGAHLVNPS